MGLFSREECWLLAALDLFFVCNVSLMFCVSGSKIFHPSASKRSQDLRHASVKEFAERLEQKLVWILFASSLFVLWQILSCASHVFGALSSREACGSLLLRGHGFPHALPIPSAFALCQTRVNGRNQAVRSALQVLVPRQLSPLLWVKPVGLLQTNASVRVVQPQSLWSL